MDDKELKELRLLIESMQSGLVELFDQLTEIRARLEMSADDSTDPTPKILPLFSEVVESSKALGFQSTTTGSSTQPEAESAEYKEEPVASMESGKGDSPHLDVSDTSVSDTAAATSAKVSRVLDPIAEELRTGKAGADIILEFLQTAKDYLIDDDPRKEKVARDIDVVLRFLRVRGKRAIRDDERENILKRMDRWKAHLAAYAGSPAA